MAVFCAWELRGDQWTTSRTVVVFEAVEITQAITYSLLFLTLYAEVFILLSFLEGYTKTDVAKPLELPANVPSVAIIVPCFNEEKTVGGTLTSLLALTYPKDKLEVIVVDDGSKDNTYAIASSFTDPRIRVFTKQNGGKHSAMNFALHKTNAEVIGCLDADSFVAPDALTASIKQLVDTAAAAVTPAIVVHEPKNALQLIQRAEYSLGVFIRRAFSAMGSIFITPGPLSLFRRDVIIAVGGWKHAHGTEDLEMGLRLQAHKYHITNTPRARVLTKTPDTVYKLYKQRVRWTYGFLMNTVDYRYMLFNKEYGSLGMVVLPAALFSIFTALYITATVIMNAVTEFAKLYTKYMIVGFHVGMPHIELFYFNTSSLALIAYVLMAIALTFLVIGRTISGGSFRSVDVPLYVLFYGFLAPLWLTGAVVRAGLRAQAPWR
jgi:cellulose synthase/poly-beta-1,6-N-acetylglucosamine synthase-like glycosyltransferase